LGKIKKILIIDDEKTLQENIAEFLTLNGFHVISANDGAEGIQKAVTHNPDFIICDIMMPNIDGLEVYRTLKNISGTIDIPFIFLTAKVRLDDLRKGMQLGADDYITKPFMLSDLLSSINTRLAKNERLKNFHEEKFNALFESPLIGIFIFYKNKIIYSNQKFVDILNISLTDVYSLSLSDILDGNKKEEFLKNIDLCSNNITNLFFTEIEVKHSVNLTKKVKIYFHNFKYNNSFALIFNVIEIENIDNIDFEEKIKSKVKDFDFEDAELSEEFSRFLETKYKAQKQNPYELILAKLSKREKEVLKLICEGFTNQEIANKLFISKRTVEGHRNTILNKTNSKNTADLVNFTVRNNLMKLL
jgi:DNA-binding NarL/FixJ family response regulator